MHDMELLLGLSLSSHSSSVSRLTLQNYQLMVMDYNNNVKMMNKKRRYGKAFEFDEDEEEEVNSTDVAVPQTLTLFVWKPNGEDSDGDESSSEKHSSSVHLNNKNGEDETGVVGWPPINSWRKKICHYHQHHQNRRNLAGSNIPNNYVTVENRGRDISVGGRGSSNPNTKYVKVKMEGVGIARKVDLSLHHSFETLTDTLIFMFGKCHESDSYKLAYQDKEGDWLLAKDVPWGAFVQSVERLKMVKKGDKIYKNSEG